MTEGIHVGGPAFDGPEDFGGPVEKWDHRDLDNYLISLASTLETLTAICREGDLTAASLVELVDGLLRVRQAKRDLADLEQALCDLVGDALGGEMTILDGIGRVKPHRRVSRTKWDKEALRSCVLDSRLVNTITGELIEETPLERIESVFPWGTPRITALRQRGIEADQFCAREDKPGWAVEIEGPG